MPPKLLTLNNIGQSGLNSDIARWELGPEYLTHGDNFRVRDGSVSPFAGSKVIFAREVGQSPAGLVMFVRVKAGDFWVQCTTDAIYATGGGGVWLDVTPAEGISMNAGRESEWTGTQLGQVVVLNHPDAGPFYWQDWTLQTLFKRLPFIVGGTEAETVTWQDKFYSCGAMRTHKTFLIAMDMREGGVVGPNVYRISHPATSGGIPYTWDTLDDRSSLAVRAVLGSDGGELVDGRSLRDSFVLYSKDAIDILDFNPNSEFFWTRRELSTTVGLLTTNCVTEVKGRHYLIVDGDVVVNNGAELSSIMHNRMLRRFNAKNNPQTKVGSFITRNDIFKEIWVCVPEGDSDTPTIAFVYNWRDDSWSVRDLPQGTVSADYGVLPNEQGDTIDNTRYWGNTGSTWAEETLPWGSATVTALNEAMAGLNFNGDVFQLDPRAEIDEEAFNSVIERTDFPLDGHRQTNMITRVYPHASGDPFLLQIGAQDQVGGPIRWEDEIEFNPGTDRNLDFRSTGEAIAWRVRSIGTQRFRLSGMDLEYVNCGVR